MRNNDTTYPLTERELMIMRRALEMYETVSTDHRSYKNEASQLRNKINNWYIDAICS